MFFVFDGLSSTCVIDTLCQKSEAAYTTCLRNLRTQLNSVRPTVHPSMLRKQSFSKTLLKLEEFENADFSFSWGRETFRKRSFSFVNDLFTGHCRSEFFLTSWLLNWIILESGVRILSFKRAPYKRPEARLTDTFTYHTCWHHRSWSRPVLYSRLRVARQILVNKADCWRFPPRFVVL